MLLFLSFNLIKLLKKVKQINEKYGIKTRCRVGKDERFYYINCCGEIDYSYDKRSVIDNKMYNIGNYFDSENEAIESDIYKLYKKQKEDLNK